jgi:hypothetical protein
MKIKTRLINKKWLELSLTTKKWQKNFVYWGGLKFSSSTIYP